MKILHVIQTLSPRNGGPVSVLKALAREQSNSGNEVTIATTNADGAGHVVCEAGWGTLEGSDVRALYASVQFMPLLFSLGLAAYLQRHIAEFDVGHVHGLYRFPSGYAARLARKRGVPVVMRPHGSLDPYLYRRSSRSVILKRAWERWVDLPNLNGASAIHYTTEDERERVGFLKLHAPSFVMPNGLDWARFERCPAHGTFRERLGLGDAPLVLFLSRINFKKGLDLLVPAFAKVRKKHPDAVLAIVGPDNEGYGAKVRGWVAENDLGSCVHLVDALEGEAVLQAYVDADVFALPSYTENFGMVVPEALACRTPVVISDQVNIHREVSEAGAGLVTRCDVSEVADAINTLLADPARRDAMGAAGRALVQRKWTWDVVAGQLTAEYAKVIARAWGRGTVGTREHE